MNFATSLISDEMAQSFLSSVVNIIKENILPALVVIGAMVGLGIVMTILTSIQEGRYLSQRQSMFNEAQRTRGRYLQRIINSNRAFARKHGMKG